MRAVQTRITAAKHSCRTCESAAFAAVASKLITAISIVCGQRASEGQSSRRCSSGQGERRTEHGRTCEAPGTAHRHERHARAARVRVSERSPDSRMRPSMLSMLSVGGMLSHPSASSQSCQQRAVQLSLRTTALKARKSPGFDAMRPASRGSRVSDDPNPLDPLGPSARDERGAACRFGCDASRAHRRE